MPPVIATRDLTKRFRRILALDGLDLEVEQGEVFGFLGPNGAGKSTALRMMVGLVRPTRGSVRLFGRDVWQDRSGALENVGALIESPAFYRYISGRDNLRILANAGGRHTDEEIDEALDIVGLLPRAGDKVKAYSQGMRQRLGVAFAIVGRPRLVLLDEPTNGLDPQGMREVRELIRGLAQDHGMTVFLSSHLLHEVEQVCTRIAVVNRGRVITSGRIGDLLGGSTTCRVCVDNPETALRTAEEMGLTAARGEDEGWLTVSLDGRSAADLNRELVNRGIAVSALSPSRTSLEELYLRLMDNA